MKKLLLVLLTATLMFSCEEQGTATDSPSSGGGGSTVPVPAYDIPYARTILPTSSLPAFSDSNYYSALVTGTVNYTTTANSASYSSSVYGSQVAIGGKFKILGDLSNNGAFAISADLNFPAYSRMMLGSFRLNFGVSSQPAFIQVALTAMTDNQLVYRLTYADENEASNDIVFNQYLAANTVANTIPISFTRDNAGVVTVSIDGHLHTFNQAILSEDVDLGSTIYGSGSGSMTNLTITPSSYAEFQGR